MIILHLILALAAYACIGVGTLQIAMAHIRHHALFDNDFMRMTAEDAARSMTMRLPQIGVAIFWPVAVVFAILMNIRNQTSRHSRYSARA